MCQGRLDAPTDAHVTHDRHTAHKHEESGAEDLRQARLNVVLIEGQLRLILMGIPSIASGYCKELWLGLRWGHLACVKLQVICAHTLRLRTDKGGQRMGWSGGKAGQQSPPSSLLVAWEKHFTITAVESIVWGRLWRLQDTAYHPPVCYYTTEHNKNVYIKLSCHSRSARLSYATELIWVNAVSQSLQI